MWKKLNTTVGLLLTSTGNLSVPAGDYLPQIISAHQYCTLCGLEFTLQHTAVRYYKTRLLKLNWNMRRLCMYVCMYLRLSFCMCACIHSNVNWLSEDNTGDVRDACLLCASMILLVYMWWYNIYIQDAHLWEDPSRIIYLKLMVDLYTCFQLYHIYSYVHCDVCTCIWIAWMFLILFSAIWV